MSGTSLLRRVVAAACATPMAAVGVAAATSGAAPGPRGQPATRDALAASARIVPTTASNRRAALRDAERLLAGVVPPAGAVLVSSGSGSGVRAHLLTSAFASAVAHRSWTVGDEPDSVLSYVSAHLPAGSKVVSTGSSGPNPISHSIIYSWPPVDGVLDVRWLEVSVAARAAGGTLLYAESQSQWIVTRPRSERIPAGVREVDVTRGLPGRPPLTSRRVTSRKPVRALVALFDALGIIQPGAINCPAETIGPIVTVIFRASASGRPLARASVSSEANFSWPPGLPGWACFPISFDVLGRSEHALAGNVIGPMQRLLHVKLAGPG